MTTMKITEIKRDVFDFLAVQDTKSLKAKYPKMVVGKDLRFKKSWQEILEKIQKMGLERHSTMTKRLYEQNLEIDLIDRKIFQMLGKDAGLNPSEIQLEWEKLKLESILEI